MVVWFSTRGVAGAFRLPLLFPLWLLTIPIKTTRSTSHFTAIPIAGGPSLSKC